MKKLNALVNFLTPDKKLQVKIKDRIRNNPETAAQLGYDTNKTSRPFCSYVDEYAFEIFIKTNYPELSPGIIGSISGIFQIGTLSAEFYINNPNPTAEEYDDLMRKYNEKCIECDDLKTQLEAANKKLNSYRPLGRPKKN
jgi:hypothetical protein